MGACVAVESSPLIVLKTEESDEIMQNYFQLFVDAGLSPRHQTRRLSTFGKNSAVAMVRTFDILIASIKIRFHKISAFLTLNGAASLCSTMPPLATPLTVTRFMQMILHAKKTPVQLKQLNLFMDLARYERCAKKKKNLGCIQYLVPWEGNIAIQDPQSTDLSCTLSPAYRMPTASWTTWNTIPCSEITFLFVDVVVDKLKKPVIFIGADCVFRVTLRQKCT